MRSVLSRQLEDTDRAAVEFVAGLSKGERATVVGLSGELGSGKTTFVQSVARSLGVFQTVTSPTFVIEKIYKLDGQQFSHLVHVDAYRLEDGNELNALGFDDVLRDSGNLVLVEWPERVASVLPERYAVVSFSFVDAATRRIRFS